jgi:hypothetical protein
MLVEAGFAEATVDESSGQQLAVAHAGEELRSSPEG